MIRALIISTLTLFSTSIWAQEVGVINDPDGYTNLRQGPSTNEPIIAKILEGERFLYFPTSNSNWWRVNYHKSRNNVFEGYIHNSRIKELYDYDPSYKKIYHEYSTTASSFRTKRRDINPDSLPNLYFVETVNNYGQIVDLRFIANGKIKSQNLCYLSPWTKFEYPDNNTIITYDLYSDGSKLTSIECDMWYKTTYTLSDDQKQILYAEIEYSIDTTALLNYGWKEDELQSALKNLNTDRIYPTVINGYIKSTAKLNGKFPIGEKFDLNNYSYTGLEFEELKKLME